MKSLLIAVIVNFALIGSLCAADLEMRQLTKIPISVKNPKQIITSGDGKRLYVLTDTGDVHLFGLRGDSQGSVNVGTDVTNIIAHGPNILLLQRTNAQEMEVVSLDPVVTISTDGSPTIGPADAPVKIVVFDDFECPYCAQAVGVLKQAQALYPDKVSLVFKNFPLSFHKNARNAAMTAMAAEKQGKFWPLHDLLYQNYKSLSPTKIRELAQQAGLNMDQLDRDMASPDVQQQIARDMQEAQRIGVRGTPAIYINGRQPSNRGIAGMRQLIESELNKNKVAVK